MLDLAYYNKVRKKRVVGLKRLMQSEMKNLN